MDGLFQEMLGASNVDIDTNVDIVFAIDATESMQPLIDKVKSLTLSFREELEKGLKENRRIIKNLRIKVIVFRDYYVDDKYAMEESQFFILPEEKQEFYNFVSQIKAGGGGDEPESGLEALALALRSDFVKDGDKKRHVIVLFTDASAHPLPMWQKSLMPMRTSQIQEMTIKGIQKNQIQETIRVTLEISERIKVIPRQVAAPIRRKNPM